MSAETNKDTRRYEKRHWVDMSARLTVVADRAKFVIDPDRWEGILFSEGPQILRDLRDLNKIFSSWNSVGPNVGHSIEKN